ncbi:hypothetical protein QR680_001714 [Steinernema hermaphroditum]|uniref:Heparan-alpha-glucosaminide N-acetyltransferase catalytic domain-containing protein n=1 Tax=Steinernema hermaphroditum TaxID=289476 RepID=A0AA39LGQ5_9BILA|nr:hypothetical protein QR680_001714 [Steinernema hermaphroditum]
MVLETCRYVHEPDLVQTMDMATLTVLGRKEMVLYAKNAACFSCSLRQVCHFNRATMKLIVNTTYGTVLKLVDHRNNTVCKREEFTFGEHGNYTLRSSTCLIEETSPPVNTDLPIYFAILAILLVTFLLGIFSLVRRNSSSSWFGEGYEALDPLSITPSKRLKSLDTFRGLTICFMIFVNYGGGGFWFFEHSPWDGLTVADAVFPWYAFAFSAFHGFTIEKNGINQAFLRRVLHRSVLLFFIGMIVINNNRDWKTLRIMGVLQRLALCYLIVSLARSMTHRRIQETQAMSTQWERFSICADLFVYVADFIFYALFALLWVGLTFWLPLGADCPRGYVGPGGLSQGGKYWNCTGGAATLIDRFVLGESHIYRNPTCKNVYECSSSFEPEGLLGTLTATINVFIGLQISQILLVFKRSKSKFIRFFAWAAVLFGAGTFLDGTFKPEIGLIPINKNLWSLSFTFVTSAVSIIVFSILFLVIDVCKWWDGSPFTFTGKNAIVLYVAHVLFRETFPVQWKVENEHPSRLALNLWGVAFWIIVGFFMHRRGIYLSL